MKKDFGGVLLSHTASRAVPSALKSLTSVFGMGTGVASSPSPPKKRFSRLYDKAFGLRYRSSQYNKYGVLPLALPKALS